MGKIDTSNWGEFRIGDLFDAERGKIKSLQKQCEGDTPVIAAGGYNQGVAGFYDVIPEYKNKITVSCNGVGCGSVFYHPYPFNLNGDAIVLTELVPMSNLVKQFISCILNGILIRKFSYEEKCSAEKAKNETIKLPIDTDGNPDWAYMESYMSNIKTTVSDSLTKLQSAKDLHNNKINTINWGSFRIGDLFEIKRPKSRSEKNYTEGNVKYVSSGCVNNGVVKYLEPINDEDLDKGKCITVSPLDGSSFWQADDFLGRGGSGASISMLYNKNLNKYNSQFICSIIRRSADKFNYQDLLCGENLKNLMIKLPVDSNGEPDWNYMEEYMKNIEEKVKKQINALK